MMLHFVPFSRFDTRFWPAGIRERKPGVAWITRIFMHKNRAADGGNPLLFPAHNAGSTHPINVKHSRCIVYKIKIKIKIMGVTVPSSPSSACWSPASALDALCSSGAGRRCAYPLPPCSCQRVSFCDRFALRLPCYHLALSTFSVP